MTTEPRPATATIYNFPARGRFATVRERDRAETATTPRLVETVMGSGWYHDEAIREEHAPPKQ